ncbi:MAG: CinA family protein [Clostridiales bacterium]|jgi:nicotinamide-nucleotide amidase|nr:CinA family protein [Clostridiales bacterium]
MNKSEQIVSILREKGLKLAIAESLTGGAVCAAIVAIPGASHILDEAMVTYSNAAKTARLGVKPATLAAHGAVSPETAAQMARGIADTAGAQIGLATTGIAGPDGATAEKPVGLVFIAAHFNGKTTTKKLTLVGNRAEIIAQTTDNSLDLLLAILCGKMD